MQLLRYVSLFLTIAACEHTSRRDDQAAQPEATQPSPDPSPAARAAADKAAVAAVGSAGSAAGSAAGNGTAAGSGDLTIAKADGDMTVRPPIAADLADYTKDLPGKGTKLSATIDTSLGTIHCELFGDKAPIAVANFVGLATGKKAFRGPDGNPAKKHFFDGLSFHRVISTFMIQGGDPEGSGRGGPGYQFPNEVADGLKMDPGALALANAGKDTNGSQFFIMEGSHPDLVGGYTIFGQCTDIDVVKKITHTPTDPNDKPLTPVLMTKVTIAKS